MATAGFLALPDGEHVNTSCHFDERTKPLQRLQRRPTDEANEIAHRRWNPGAANFISTSSQTPWGCGLHQFSRMGSWELHHHRRLTSKFQLLARSTRPDPISVAILSLNFGWDFCLLLAIKSEHCSLCWFLATFLADTCHWLQGDVYVQFTRLCLCCGVFCWTYAHCSDGRKENLEGHQFQFQTILSAPSLLSFLVNTKPWIQSLVLRSMFQRPLRTPFFKSIILPFKGIIHCKNLLLMKIEGVYGILCTKSSY